MSSNLRPIAFRVYKMEMRDSILMRPLVEIVVHDWKNPKDLNRPTLSTQLMTSKDIDERIDYLQGTLETLRKQAKIAFAKEQAVVIPK